MGLWYRDEGMKDFSVKDDGVLDDSVRKMSSVMIGQQASLTDEDVGLELGEDCKRRYGLSSVLAQDIPTNVEMAFTLVVFRKAIAACGLYDLPMSGYPCISVVKNSWQGASTMSFLDKLKVVIDHLQSWGCFAAIVRDSTSGFIAGRMSLHEGVPMVKECEALALLDAITWVADLGFEGCGSCGYELSLNSSSRNTATIGSKYGKSIKRGIISFFNIDESRFTQVDEFQCVPYFSKHSWGLFRRRTKLLCRKCGNHIGNAYEDKTSNYPSVLDGFESASGNEVSVHKKYDIRICALQPLSAEGLGTPLFA
ncbi:hypothetical protein PTKIN_Ptkin09bG0179300 [Pterospermum kingtungense]